MFKKGILFLALAMVITACGGDNGTSTNGQNNTGNSLQVNTSDSAGHDGLDELEVDTELGEAVFTDENIDINPADITGSKLEELIATYEEIITSVEVPIIEEDFDGDGFKDLAVVLEEKESSNDEPKKRTLLVASGHEDGGYHFPEYHEELIYLSDEGGVMGDPFVGLSYDEEYGTFGINHYGGSNWRWSNTLHVTMIEQGWSVVGYSSETFNVNDGTSTIIEYDLSMGDIYYEMVDENGESTIEFLTAPVKGEILLSNFNHETFDMEVHDNISAQLNNY